MKLVATLVTGLALLAGLSVPAQAARISSDQVPAEQNAKAGDIQIAGLVLSEYVEE
jgi:uncharacterized protein involved in high-affinity Fe2+ transport